MYDFHPHGSSHAPLDFNLPRRTDTVADAPGSGSVRPSATRCPPPTSTPGQC